MHGTPAHSTAPLPFRRKIAFVLAIVFGLALLAELGSWVACSSILGGDAGPLGVSAALHQRRVALEDTNLRNDTFVVEDHQVPFRTSHARHPYLGYVLNPEGPTETPATGRRVNEFGFHDREDTIQHRGPGRFLIGILGGSVAGMFYEHGAPVLAEELHADPRFADRDIHFVDLAVGGYKQPQQVMALSYSLALGGEFDLILNLDGFNEIGLYESNHLRTAVHYSYPRNWAVLAEENGSPVLRAAKEETYRIRRLRKAVAGFVDRSVGRLSGVCNLLWLVRDRRWEMRIAEIQVELVNTPTALEGSTFEARGPRREFGSDSEMYGELVAVWKRCSSLLADLCRANDVQYVHVLQPNQYFDGSKPIGPEEAKVAVNPRSPYRKAVGVAYPLLQEAGRELESRGIHFFDETQVFADHPEQLYIDDCCHLGEEGNAVLARAIARRILEVAAPR